MLVLLGLASVLQTNLPSTSLRFEISKRLSCDASQSLLQFSSNSFSGGGLVEILTTRL